MTYFLGEKNDMGQVKPRGFGLRPTGLLEGLGASFDKAALENDANFRLNRERGRVETERVDATIGILGETAVMDRLKQVGLIPDTLTAPNEVLMKNERARAEILNYAREQQSANPDLWKDIDVSQEGIEATVNSRLQAEHQDAETILNMMPEWRGVTDFAGGMAGITADVKNLPFLLLGGGSGSLMRVMTREAGINMAAEAAFLPAQYEMAERLDIPDPDPVLQLAMAAGAGAVIGGGIEAISRGYRYVRDRQQVPEGVDPVFGASAMDAAEDALIVGDNPVEAINRTMAEKPPPFLLENPINPQRPPLILTDPITPEPTALAPDPITTARLDDPQTEAPPPAEPRVLTDIPSIRARIESDYDEAISEARGADSGKARPLTSFFQSRVKKDKNATAGMKSVQRSMQIDPDSPAGQELKNLGVTAKAAPGLFRKGGLKDVDNLVADELEGTFPGIKEAAGVSDDGIYLDRDGLLELIARDVRGDDSWLRSRAEVNRLERERNEILEAIDSGRYSAEEMFLIGARTEDGFFVDPAAYEAQFGPAWIEAMRGDLEEYLSAKFPAPFSRAEFDEIFDAAQRGGEVEFLVERMLEREIDYAKLPMREADDYGTYDPEEYARFLDQSEADELAAGGFGDPETPGPDAQPARGGAAGGGDGELTGAGYQLVVPGVEPITQRQRLEQRQNAPLRGGDRAMDAGLFDTGARAQLDMFSDPVDAKARPVQDAMVEDLRDAVSTDDFMVDVGDGRGARPASSLLDELDGDTEFLAILDACGKRRTE